MTGWAERQARAASLLAGRSAARLAQGSGAPAAYFRMFRRFLSPLRCWDVPAWGRGLSRRQRAVLVATLHEGWDEEDTAELCGLSQAKVRALALPEKERAPLAARLREAATTPGPAPARFPKLAACLCLLGMAGMAGSAAVVPVVSSASPPLPVLPAVAAEPIRYGMRVQAELFPERIEPFASAAPSEGWLVVGTSGRRWQLPDALPETDVQVSPDGRKLAYYSLARMQVVIRDLTTGAITPVSTAFYQVRLAFSADSRYLALKQPDDVVVTDVQSGVVTRIRSDEALLGWAGDHLVMSHSYDRIKVLALDGSVITKPQATELKSYWQLAVSPNGKAIAVPSGGRVLILDHGGKVIRKVHARLPPTAEPRRIYRWEGPDDVLLYAPGYGSATVYVMDVLTGATRPVPHAPEVAASDFTIGAA
ncbi:TolB family protein [Microtetraspora malaysiensis]|uniref:TolB family protein n=1 Tax=Microtetraspora malaysiensis TaxID=161358 RepID=A0ABW6SK62_9ACTN